MIVKIIEYCSTSLSLEFEPNSEVKIKQFVQQLHEEGIDDFFSLEFLYSFLDFLIERKVTHKEANMFSTLISLARDPDPIFNIDGAYGPGCIPDCSIDVEAINDVMYTVLSDDEYDEYRDSDVFLVFMAFCLINNYKEAVKAKLIEAIPEIQLYEELLSF